MINPVSSTLAGATTTAQPAMGLGKDDFLKLLVTQLRYQDPLEPLDQNQFLAQTAQFSSLEELQSIGRSIEALKTTTANASLTQGAGLLGKTAKVATGTVGFDGVAEAPLALTLDGAASHVKVEILDGQGKVLRTLTTGAAPAGQIAVTWDGKDDAGSGLLSGTYGYRVSATGSGGAAPLAYVTEGVLTGLSSQDGRVSYRLGDRFVTTDDIVDLR
jgi:flagellar basal-body rod modification protein FlgD